MYDEHAQQARQHENQREKMTSIILVVVGALVTFVTTTQFALYSLPASLFIVFVGLYGYFFSRKHYERNRLHTSILAEFRDEIDKEIGIIQPDPEHPAGKSCWEIRNRGEKRHYDYFPEPVREIQKDAKSWIARQRLHPFWSAIPLTAVFTGVLLTGLTVLRSL